MVGVEGIVGGIEGLEHIAGNIVVVVQVGIVGVGTHSVEGRAVEADSGVEDIGAVVVVAVDV